MRSLIALPLVSMVFASAAFAQMTNEDTCLRDAAGGCVNEPSRVREPLKEIYPFKPFSTDLINSRLDRLTEGHEYTSNINIIDQRGLQKANAKVR